MAFALNEAERQGLNRRLLDYLYRSALRREDHLRIGPFVVGFDDGDDNPYLNYAIPEGNADPSSADIAALIAAFEQRKRKPRLEYIPDAAPKVEPKLPRHGFTAAPRMPIMLCSPDMARGEPVAAGFEIFSAISLVDLSGAESAQAEAYDGPARGPDGLLRTVAAGGLVVAARDVATGAIVGAAIVTPPLDGVGELAGVGVRNGARRRGVAGAMTVLLVCEAFARGLALLWLTPEGSAAERIYARAGFVVASEALHISR